MEYSNVKLILKEIAHSCMAKLIVLNLIIFFLILWNGSQKVYECWFEDLPPELKYLSSLDTWIYNIIIIILIVNAITLISRICRAANTMNSEFELLIITIYMSLSSVLISIGYSFLKLTTHGTVTEESFILKFLSKILGTRIKTEAGVENLYIILSIMVILLTQICLIKLLKSSMKQIRKSWNTIELSPNKDKGNIAIKFNYMMFQ